MGTRSLVGLMGLLAVGGGLVAQEPPPHQKTEGTRDLFYFGATQKDTLPPIRKVSTGGRTRSTPAPTLSAGTETDRAPVTPGEAVDAASVAHLGFRYTVALVNQNTGKAEAVDPDRDFRKGECVRLEVESNHSGYLYVLSKQSSGGWLPLFPSSEMPDESNVADPGQKVRAPKDYCFEISDPPGTETLFVVLSRSPRDFFELYDAIKNPPSAAPANTTRSNSNPVQMADMRVNSAVEKMAKTFGTRDLIIRKVTPAADRQDSDYSVYVVNGSDRPSSTVVKKVEIRHR
jgi:Domain of unknown function (DUF4384)